MPVKKTMTPEERAKRIENFKRALPQIIAARKKKEIAMGFFTISRKEDETLEHMTVRALADSPDSSHAYFDTNGVFITDNDGLITEIKDFVISEATPPIYTPTLDPFALDGCELL